MVDVVKITKRVVDTLESKGSSPAFLWDDALPGFAVKALLSGTKRYVLKYRVGGGRAAKQRWLTLGTHGQLTPDQARALAQQALAAVARGEDPQAEKYKSRNQPTLTDVWNRFRAEHLPQRKPQTRYEYENQWREAIAPKLGRVAIDDVTRSEVDRLHKSMRLTPYRANRILALLSRLMTMAEVWELRPAGSNPCRHVERFKEQPRSRYLCAEELVRLGATMREMVEKGNLSPSAANAVRLLLLTGARLNEILTARWDWVDRDRCVLSLPDSKTGAKPVYLSAGALLVLDDQRSHSADNPYIFPGRSAEGRMINLRKPWVRICKGAGLDGVRLHDLRHTAASIAVGQGASLPIIGRLLGHSQAQTTHRYAHVDADPALIVANAIGDVLVAKISG
ncbi:tyrosine-type recombinase/integrase [Erythrobacter sp. W302b]|uniref:tyrosine-type recombinase/integrase n=1 Tax=Erythrobacter sp. W302b TaxID=3389874 RepID=UPI00396B0D65